MYDSAGGVVWRVRGGGGRHPSEQRLGRVHGVGQRGTGDESGTVETDKEGRKMEQYGCSNYPMMFNVPVEVQGMWVQAVVDTAGQVTQLSEDFYRSLNPAPPIHREVVMHTTGK